jgi:hypothetical protein
MLSVLNIIWAQECNQTLYTPSFVWFIIVAVWVGQEVSSVFHLHIYFGDIAADCMQTIGTYTYRHCVVVLTINYQLLL